MTVSRYRELVDKRVAADSRQTIRVQVCLDPDMLTELDEARTAATTSTPAPARRTLGDTPPTIDTAALERIAAAEQAVLDTTITVTLSTLSADDLLTAQADLPTDTPMAVMWQRHLTTAFRRAENGHGQMVDDIDRDVWAKLLDVIPAGELQTWHGQLSKASQINVLLCC